MTFPQTSVVKNEDLYIHTDIDLYSFSTFKNKTKLVFRKICYTKSWPSFNIPTLAGLLRRVRQRPRPVLLCLWCPCASPRDLVRMQILMQEARGGPDTLHSQQAAR